MRTRVWFIDLFVGSFCLKVSFDTLMALLISTFDINSDHDSIEFEVVLNEHLILTHCHRV